MKTDGAFDKALNVLTKEVRQMYGDLNQGLLSSCLAAWAERFPTVRRYALNR